MLFDTNIPLKNLNSFGFDAIAEKAICIEKPEDLVPALKECQSQGWAWRTLGGGSNVVLNDKLDGLTLLMRIKGRRLIDQTPSHWIIQVGAGENWHDFVAWTLEQGWPGLENLALIPGTCGAAPIQNIGAYGSEVAQTIQSVRVLDLNMLHEADPWIDIQNKDCALSYRDSLFKHDPNRYIVTQVTFALPKEWAPNLSYAELANYIEQHTSVTSVTPKQIFDAVCTIRQAKLPDPKVIGNAGSFFHNPIVSSAKHHELKAKFPNLVAYPTSGKDGQAQFKLAAGWLIDQCGFKGYRSGNVGVYDKQALVLVHYGQGSGAELLELARLIKEKIHAVYGVDLIQEPVIY
jgi:UDP-N-acetylmuramate dehydrogenase